MFSTEVTTSQVFTMYAGIFVFFFVLAVALLKKNS
jgi:hypothetical protein